MRRDFTWHGISLYTLLLALGVGGLALPVGPQALAHSTAAAQNCPLPLRITLTFLSNEPTTATRRGSNRWRVDWELTGLLPEGVTGIRSFTIHVHDHLGSETATASGTARSSVVNVEHSRTVPLTTSGIPFATVSGVAECQRTSKSRTAPDWEECDGSRVALLVLAKRRLFFTVWHA